MAKGLMMGTDVGWGRSQTIECLKLKGDGKSLAVIARWSKRYECSNGSQLMDKTPEPWHGKKAK